MDDIWWLVFLANTCARDTLTAKVTIAMTKESWMTLPTIYFSSGYERGGGLGKGRVDGRGRVVDSRKGGCRERVYRLYSKRRH